MTYAVIDLETTVRNTVGGNKGSAFCPENRIVVGGMLSGGATALRPDVSHILDFLKDFEGTIVGANVKFDIHWLRREGFDFYAFVRRGGKVWDISIAEYVLSAQEKKFPSLDDMAPLYGGTLKDNRIKELWDAGIDTDQIDYDMLCSYNEADLLNTEKVYLGQLDKAKQAGQLSLIETMMEAALAVMEIEWNGMPVDLKELDVQGQRLFNEIEQIGNQIPAFLPEAVRGIINLSSPIQLSAVFFGGTVKWTEKVEDGVFKTGAKKGQPKFRNQENQVVLPRLFVPETHWETKRPGVYSVDDSVLEALAARGSELTVVLRKYRALDKEYSTYAESLPALIYPDGKVHPNLHQTSTNTGRFSCSEPNLQNQPTGSEIKRVFKSRWPEGRLLSLDFKQVEVIVAAWDSGDRQMRQDILDGLDVHEQTGKKVFPGQTMTKAQKREVKGINFGKCIYGGGTNTVHLQTGVAKEIIEAVAGAFFARYPQFREWQKALCQEIEQNAHYEGDRTAEGTPCRRAEYWTLTGRCYRFIEQTPPDWLRERGVETSFNPPEIKNRRIQGTATGDIVPMVLGECMRLAASRPDRIKLANTIHDSIVFDCKDQEVAEKAAKFFKGVAESAPAMLKERFGIEFDLPLTVEYAIGADWYEVDQE